MTGHPPNQTVDLLGFLVLGLVGSVGHCVAMCSPFVLFVSRRFAGDGGRRTVAAQGWYHAGRIVTYVVLGALAGALGAAVEAAGALVGLQRAASLVAGGVLVAWAVVALSDLHVFVPRGAGHPGSPGKSALMRLLKGRVPGHPFAAGLVLGLLPCGLLYSAVIGAVTRGGMMDGAAALALFGLGTAPALLGISGVDALFARSRPFLNRLAQVFILVMGARFVWRGLGG